MRLASVERCYDSWYLRGCLRKVVLAGCLLCIVGIFVQGFANFIMMLIGGKLISILGYGLGHALSHVYVAEIVPDNLRGICLTLVVS
jgi:SP family general alpha glucoside:H+ symporter-like MFS transporter